MATTNYSAKPLQTFILVIKQVIWVLEVYSNLHPSSTIPHKKSTHTKRKEKKEGLVSSLLLTEQQTAYLHPCEIQGSIA